MIMDFLNVKAVCFVGFLVGFITVLCIGNYFRAKRAQERQRQRRLAKQAASQQKQGYGVSNRFHSVQQNYSEQQVPTSPGSSTYMNQEMEMIGNNEGYQPPMVPISA